MNPSTLEDFDDDQDAALAALQNRINAELLRDAANERDINSMKHRKANEVKKESVFENERKQIKQERVEDESLW